MSTIDMKMIEADVLIIGSGVAVLRAGLEVSRRGRTALIVSKSPVGRANNTYLAGGSRGTVTFRCLRVPCVLCYLM